MPNNDKTYDGIATKNEEYIIFEEINPYNKIWEGKNHEHNTQHQRYPSPIPGKYNSLYEEIIIKCNPSNFMSHYNPELLNTAHELYIRAENHKQDIQTLKELRKEITMKLGITFSTEQLFNDLRDSLNPTNFNGDHNKFTEANLLYHKTLLCADNIESLERIKEEAKKKDLYKSFIESPPEEIPLSTISMYIVYILIIFLVLFFIVNFSSN